MTGITYTIRRNRDKTFTLYRSEYEDREVGGVMMRFTSMDRVRVVCTVNSKNEAARIQAEQERRDAGKTLGAP